MPTQRPPTLDPRAAARWLHAAPPASSPWLHEEVGRRMEQRLQWIVAQPRRWIDWQPLRGGVEAHRLVARRYPQAVCDVVEATAAQAAQARQALGAAWWHPGRWRGGATAFTSAPETLADGSADMVWANMALHAAADPQALIGQWHRLLATDGYLMFSCLGPDSLRELHAVYTTLGWPPAGSAFTDMHDWGDMLVHAGFAEPVMDMERIVLTYETADRLLDDLRGLGRNLHPGRFPGLRGRRFRQRLCYALTERLAVPGEGGRLALTFEIVYGHAFKPVPRARLAPESAVSLGEMRSMLRRGRDGG
ncbi:methyltransferase domain-containing protein [uncultured Xylophilus sp.]|uniref:methyltransferase domain-containing protein n=1 Tax=uncultured Xylophilus sp. TaxID=296832 RepID=UPI0025EAB642|nr:methyltransferase domain-containing protein [uncultured Xylophilus sp.]